MKNLITQIITSCFVLMTIVSSVHGQTNCPTPAGLTATNITTNSAQLNWTVPAPSGASYYNVQYRISGSASWTQVISQLQSYSAINLTCGTAYEWRVQSVCANSGTGSTSAFSATSVFTTLPCTNSCPAPTGLNTTNISTTGAVLSWIVGTGSGNTYNLRYQASNQTTWTNISNASSPYQLGGLLCNTTYVWQVQAICVNSSGTTTLSPWSASATFTTLPCTSTCPAPSTLTSANITTTSATISWNPIAGAATYTIRYRAVGTLAWTYTTSTTNSKNLTGLLCNTGYEWRVRANCANSPNTPPSPYSAIANFTTLPCTTACPAPTGLTSTNISATSTTIAWNAVAGAGSYTIRYRPVGATLWSYMNSTAASANLTALNCSTAYEWRVRSNCSLTNTTSGYSAIANFTTLVCPTTCTAPAQLTATAVTSTSANLTWSAVPGAVGYLLQYTTAGTPGFTQVNVTTNSYNLTGLSPNTVYMYQVRTLCGGTSSPTYSSWSQLFTFLTSGPTNSCGVPAGLTATSTSPQGIVLGWNAVAGAFSYNIQYRVLNTNVWTTTTSATNSKQIGPLTTGAVYEFQVQAVCAGTNGTAITSAFSQSFIFTAPVIINIYPNPADRQIYLNVSEELAADGFVEVRNLSGVVIYQSVVQATTDELVVETGTWKEGLYHVTLRMGDKVVSSRFLIQR